MGMGISGRIGRRMTGVMAALAVVLATGAVTHQSAVAASTEKVPSKHHGSGLGEKQDYDARQGSSATSKGAISRRAATASSRTATQQLRRGLGDVRWSTWTARPARPVVGPASTASSPRAPASRAPRPP